MSMVATEVEPPRTEGEDVIRGRILHTLGIYPKQSYSMLQVAIGTGLSPQLWHPVLDRMLNEGIVHKRQVTETTPSGRSQVYTIISLAE